MFEYDYCFCGNPDNCPVKDECKRAIRVPGIHTYAPFYNEGEDCEYFWEKKESKKAINEDEVLGEIEIKFRNGSIKSYWTSEGYTWFIEEGKNILTIEKRDYDKDGKIIARTDYMYPLDTIESAVQVVIDREKFNIEKVNNNYREIYTSKDIKDVIEVIKLKTKKTFIDGQFDKEAAIFNDGVAMAISELYNMIKGD